MKRFARSLFGILFLWALALVGPVPAVAQAGNEPPRALTDRGLENLEAFTRLHGYVRFFHPSDQAAAADWDQVTLAGVQRVEGAAGPGELAKALQDLFAPLAPTVQVFPTAKAPAPLPQPLPPKKPAPSARFLAWSHTGVGVSQRSVFYSSRRVGDLSELDNAGNLLHRLDATPLRGKRLRLRAAVRAEVQGEDFARLHLAALAGRQIQASPDAEKSPVREAQWRQVEASLEVPADAVQVFAGLTLPTGGRAWIDDVFLEVEGEGRNLLSDPGFEAAAPGQAPAGWSVGEYGYAAAVGEDRPHGGKRSLQVSYTPFPRPPLPRPGEVFQADLGGGVSVRVPLALLTEGGKTLPAVAPDRLPPAPDKPAGFLPNGDDRATRLAAVVQAWNVLQHFYPYFEVVPADWPASLRQALRSAASEGGEAAFEATLDTLLAGLHDGHARAIPPNGFPKHQLPLAWEWIEDRLVVTHADPQAAPGIQRGSVVLSLDGKPTARVVGARERRTSGSRAEHVRWLAVQALLRGERDEKVRLELLSPQGETSTVELARTAAAGSVRAPRPDKISELRPGVLYVDPEQLGPQEFQAALPRLAAARAVIFDLRGYPRFSFTQFLGPLMRTPTPRPRMEVPFVHRPDRQDLRFQQDEWSLEPAPPHVPGKLVFLTDARAVSAAESLLGTIEGGRLAEIVGGSTAGTNGDVNEFKVPGGYTVRFTGLRVRKPDGSRHHGVGIQPTVPASRTVAGVIAGRDELLEKALEILTPSQNLDLEQGELGKTPLGWREKDPIGRVRCTLSDEKPEGGARCARLQGRQEWSGESPAHLIQVLDAEPYRGKRVRFRGALRAEVHDDGYGQLWIEVERPQVLGFWDDTAETPARSPEWRRFEVTADIPADATHIRYGAGLVGTGTLWMDSTSLEVIGAAGEGNEPPRPLTARGLDNLAAFTRLLGYVRFFHPSDQAAAADWSRVALAGVQRAEKADGPAALAAVLQEFFAPLAPTVQVFPAGAPPSPLPLPEAPEGRSLAWSHAGVGLDVLNPIYWSERVDTAPNKREDKRENKRLNLIAPAPLPRLGEVFQADLGAGISARIPLALPAGPSGTLPAVPADRRQPAPGKPDGFPMNGGDRATRLAAVALAWNVFQHFYPYFDAVETNWPEALRQALRTAATDPDEAAFRETLEHLVAALHDGHGSVNGPGTPPWTQLYQLPLVWDWIEDRLVVTHVEPEHAETVPRGSVVLTLDGKPAAEALREHQERISGSTPHYLLWRGLRSLTYGDGIPGEKVRLELLLPDGKAATVDLTRSIPVNAFQDPRPAKVQEMRPGIFYVDLARLHDQEVDRVVERLAAARGIVFDMRGYPRGFRILGHLTDRPVHTARLLTPVVRRPDGQATGYSEGAWPVEPAEPGLRARVAFLTSARAISAAETLMGIVEHHKLGEIVGGPTAGTNGNVNPFTLPGGFRVAWTGMRVLKQDGSRHHGVGILPTVPVSRTRQAAIEGRDEVLEKGLEIVSR